jgi:predicted SAM-dependent methyltransferase
MTIKLNVGCGRRDFGKEWVHIDGADYPHINSKDVFLGNYKDNSVDIIYSSHLIEYFDREEVVSLLKSWHRVLKPTGELLIAVPDFDAIVKLYSDKEYELEQFLGLLYGRMELNGSKIYHKTVYNFKSLCRVLSDCGFFGMYETKNLIHETNCGFRGHWSFNLPDDHSKAVLPHMANGGTHVSLNVICYK